MKESEIASQDEELGENEVLLLDALQTTVGDDVALLRRLFSCFGEVHAVTSVTQKGRGDGDSRLLPSQCVKIVFDSRRSAELCIGRIVQTEVVTDCLHRGYVFLGYYRFLVEGRPPRKREREEHPTVEVDALLPTSSADEVSQAHQLQKEAPHSEPSAPPTPQQTLLLLRISACPDHGVTSANLDCLSPYMIYQMLRDSCFPTRVVLCKKKGGELSGSARHDTRQALVQVDRSETAMSVASAFNGTIVEFVDGPNAASPRFLRVKVWACEAKRDAGRPERNELNVPVNGSGALCVTRQSIGKIGGVFDRRWSSSRLRPELQPEEAKPSALSSTTLETASVALPSEYWERVFSHQYQRYYYVVSGGPGSALRTTWDEPPVEAFVEGRVRL